MDDLLSGTITELRAGRSIRELARLAGIAGGHLSRLEAGKIEKPSMDTLLALARALNRDPKLLWIVAGHIDGDEALSLMRERLTPSSEVLEDLKSRGEGKEAQRALKALGKASLSDAETRGVAALLLKAEAEETTWWEAYLTPALKQLGDSELTEVVEGFRRIQHGPRGRRVLEYIRDQVALDSVERPVQ